MCLHCQNRAYNTYFIHCKQSKYNETHMCYTTISYNFFLVNLSQCSQRCINDSYLTNSAYPRSQVCTPLRKEIQVNTYQTITSLFQQYSSQLNTSCCTCFNMSFGQPQMQWHLRYFDCESLKETPPL